MVRGHGNACRESVNMFRKGRECIRQCSSYGIDIKKSITAFFAWLFFGYQAFSAYASCNPQQSFCDFGSNFEMLGDQLLKGKTQTIHNNEDFR